MIRPNFDFYEVRLSYDAAGYLYQMDNYGKDGKLVNNRLGVATDKLKYDEHGNFTQWKVFDSQGKAVIGNLPGSAGGNHYYNEFGDQKRTEVFDLEDKLMVGNWGYAAVEREFDKGGNSVRRTLYDQDEAVIRMGGNIYSMSFKYNKINQMTEVVYLGAEDKPTIEQRQGIAKARYAFDKNHEMTERKYFDEKGKLVINKMRGYAMERYSRNAGTGKVDSVRYNSLKEVIKGQ